MGSHALSRVADWKRVREEGDRGRCGGLQVQVVHSEPHAPSRLGLRVRSSGRARAVTRNRARRRLREAWRQVAPPMGVDAVIHTDGTYADKNFHELSTELREALARAGVGGQ